MLNAVFYTATVSSRIIENASFLPLFKAVWKQKEVLSVETVKSSVEK